MKIENVKIEELILNSLRMINDGLDDEKKFAVDTNTALFGKDSNIDSLALVSLIVDIESSIFSEFNLDISLTDDRAMTREKSPFKNVSSLKEYIIELVEELD
ncbi:MAG: hypothetical protein V1773_07335 [bacterium]